jgi:DNA-binding SARP family transcriptional activator
VDYRILGPLEVVGTDGRRVELGAPLQRAVLAVLLVHANEVVSIDRLIDDLWGETPPNAATASLQAYVSNLRRVLEPDRAPRAPPTVLVTEAPGYILRVVDDQIDAVLFERLAAEGRRSLEAGNATGAIQAFDHALDLWRGEALADFAYEPFASSDIQRLHERRASVEEDRVEARLVAGEHSTALATLSRLVAAYPLRERLRGLQIRALYRAGRQADALRAFEDTRRLLADELGLDPGRELQTLQRQVLEQDPALDLVAVNGPVRISVKAAPLRRAPPAASSGFVGRDAALSCLLAAVDDARAGRSRMVLVEGEPGIGKTRLAAELADRVRDAGVDACWGRCHDDEGAPPLWPWVQVLRGFGIGSEPLPAHLQPVLATLLPELGSAPDDELVADAARFRLFDAVREIIDRHAAGHPSVIILDDVHWADVSSLRLLRFLAIELRDAPVLLTVTFRDTEGTSSAALGDTLADISRRSDVERLRLSGLSERDVADLLRLTTDVPESDLLSIAASLHYRTNGNPFFLTELVRLMQSEHRLDASDTALAVDVPLAVGDVIRRRLNRLPDDVQTVLGVASVIGRQFDLDVLAQACGLDLDRTLEALEAALATRIVVDSGPARYRFTHALVSETLYADLAPTRRVRLHGRVAAAIEATWPGDLQPHYNELAYHYGHGPVTDGEHALRYACLAGEQAASRLAYDEAALQWRAALEAFDRTAGATPAARARLLLELASAERRSGNLAAGSAAHDEALAVAERSDDPALVAEAALAYGEVGLWQVRRYGTVDEHVVQAITDALTRVPAGDSALRAQLLTGLAMALYYREGDRERGQSLAREAAAMARRLGDDTLRATILVELLVMLDAVPDPTEQMQAAAELATLEQSGLPREAASAYVMRLARMGLSHGNATTVERDIEDFARLAAAARHPDEQLWATWARTTMAFLQDRLDDAERLAGEAFSLHDRLGIWGAHETYATHMVFIWREQGRLLAAAPVIEPLLARSVHPSASKLRGIVALERLAAHELRSLLGPDPVPRSRDFTWLADMCITAELAAAARLPCCPELYAMLKPFQGRVATMDATFLCLGAVAYYLGLLADALDRPDDAHRHFEHAIALNDAIGAAPWSRRARARSERDRATCPS